MESSRCLSHYAQQRSCSKCCRLMNWIALLSRSQPFFFFFYCIMDNVNIRFSFLKDCFANKVVKLCMKWDTSVQTHLNSSSKDVPLHLPAFVSSWKKSTASFGKGGNIKIWNTTNGHWKTHSNICHSIICWKKQNLSGPLALDLSWTVSYTQCYWPFALLLCLWMDARQRYRVVTSLKKHFFPLVPLNKNVFVFSCSPKTSSIWIWQLY